MHQIVAHPLTLGGYQTHRLSAPADRSRIAATWAATATRRSTALANSTANGGTPRPEPF